MSVENIKKLISQIDQNQFTDARETLKAEVGERITKNVNTKIETLGYKLPTKE